VLPLSTAYTVCEGLGFESGIDKSFSQAPFFYWFYTFLIAGGAAVVLIPDFPLVQFSIFSQALNGVLLPIVIVFMLLLINRKDLMGKYVNSHWFNAAAWLTAIIVTILSGLLMVQQISNAWKH
jgi:Mn2+/Fe2+ NRAMP family transporter